MEHLKDTIRTAFVEAHKINESIIGDTLRNLIGVDLCLSRINGVEGKRMGLSKDLVAHAETLHEMINREIQDRIVSDEKYEELKGAINQCARDYLSAVSDYYKQESHPDPKHLDGYMEITPKTRDQFLKSLDIIRTGKSTDHPVYHLVHFDDFSEDRDPSAQKIRFRTTMESAEWFLDEIEKAFPSVSGGNTSSEGSIEIKATVFINNFGFDESRDVLVEGDLRGFPKLEGAPNGRSISFVGTVMGNRETFPAYNVYEPPLEIAKAIA